MQTGIRPLVVIPIWIPFRSSSKIELLNVASRIVAHQKSLSEDTAVFAYIEVEALYLEGSHGVERSGRKLEQCGGYVRRITTLTSIIRDQHSSIDCQPRIEFEKFVLQPGAEGPNAHVLEGEIGIAWPEESVFGASPYLAFNQRRATKELGTIILDIVKTIHPFSFTIQKSIAVNINKRIRAVLDSMATYTASADWQNNAAVIQGTLNLALNLEYEDGTLGRWSEPINYQVPEPLPANYEHNLYVFVDQCHVDPQPVTSASMIRIAVTVKGIIAETSPEVISLHAPSIETTPQFKIMRISGAADTPISCQKKELSRTVTLPGVPTGHITHKLKCGILEQTGSSLLQEITALCDLFYIDGEGEKCLEIQLTDILLTPIGNFPETAFYYGTVSADGDPIITMDLRDPHKFSLVIPFSHQVTMRETKIVDAYIRIADANAGFAVDTGCTEETLDSLRLVDAVVEEIVAQKQTSFLVEFPVQMKYAAASKRSRVGKTTLSEPIPELAYECLPETDCCLIKGTINLASYVTGRDGKEVYYPAKADFCEKLLIPGCRPDLKQRCSLQATVIKPATPAGTPSVLVEANLILYQYRRCEILSGTPIQANLAIQANRTAQAFHAAQDAQSPQSGYANKAGTSITATPNEYGNQQVALEHRIFWQSRPPSGTGAEPVRIETKAEDLRWRITNELLIIDGMVGRLLYFADRNQRLYCSGARIPFRMAALLPDQPENIRRIRIQRIDGMALPKVKKGIQLYLEEEYRVFLEIF